MRREADERRARTVRRWARRAAIATATVALAGAASLVGVSGGWRLRLTREDGSPVAGAWVAYVHEGTRFNPVDSGMADVRRGGVVRSDAGGTVRIPGRVFLKKGPLDRAPAPRIALLYAPALHLARPLGAARAWRERQRPAVDSVEPAGDGLGFVLADVTADPDGWERSIDAMYRLASDEAYANDTRLVLDAHALGELVASLRSEYEALRAAHARTARGAPPHHPYLDTLQPEERRRAEERMRKERDDEPLVGPWIERRWRKRIEALEQAARKAR